MGWRLGQEGVWGGCSPPQPALWVHRVASYPQLSRLCAIFKSAHPSCTNPVLSVALLGLCCLVLSPSWQALGEGLTSSWLSHTPD